MEYPDEHWMKENIGLVFSGKTQSPTLDCELNLCGKDPGATQENLCISIVVAITYGKSVISCSVGFLTPKT